MYVDTHAHLFYPNFNGELDDIISRAKNAGVKQIIVPGTDIATSAEAVKLSEKYEEVYAAVGIHPHETKEWEDSLLDDLRELANHEKVIAIGEIGLDYYYDFSPRDIQIKAFQKQIDLALELKKPIIVHNRESNDDVMDFAKMYKNTDLKIQFHCFAGSVKDARELIELNHFISFPGNVTFKKADNIRNVLSRIDLENLLLETDSPFMTPVPHRGKRNEPAYIPLIVETIADVHGVTTEDVARATTYNVYKLFGIGKKPELSFTYKIGNSLYINVTNRCNADCVFCDRKGEAIISGYNLKMSKSEEPGAETYISEIGDPKKYKEIVFCGYGEPTIRWDVVKTVAKYVKDNGGKTRMNTDGHGNFINKKDITPELSGLIDTVSISLNSTDPGQYAKLMRVDPKLHAEMIDFAKKANNYSHVVMSIVGLNEVDTEKAKQFVTQEMGVDFRLREFF
ncbi:MAG: YchF/TatD family DNA exonuclease [Melioribacteraceae bacterium]|nr:YchF/TatD family DNA exonuclease [Melioribacteraceae bacterium]MCF8354816.1 YchF/TatD family DNA exonuclease [Melioribacteraceae bacterium]MCF8394553.1 YchF/TatD family DNA exonuclease [Melioribacteraceae bacterium]MCF8420212.1 YchF/TatD family DNA exonuclease [Melioribacteraceae bacterium]